MKVYLGANAAGGYQPIGCDERLMHAFPADFAERKKEIERYLNDDHAPDWTKHDLVEAGDIYASVLRKIYPELEDVVARALANRFTFGLR